MGYTRIYISAQISHLVNKTIIFLDVKHFCKRTRMVANCFSKDAVAAKLSFDLHQQQRSEPRANSLSIRAQYNNYTTIGSKFLIG